MAKRPLSIFAIGLIFGGGIGFAIAAGNGIAFEPHDHANPAHHGAGTGHSMHSHPVRDIADGETLPTLDVEVSKDPMEGWNLRLATTGFTFSPEGANGAHVDGQGHAHVYANGAKISRIYGEWLHIPALPAGEVTLRVTLNSNDHSELAVNGQVVERLVTVQN